MNYNHIVQKRRELRIPGFSTLSDVGMDGPWVSPYQIASRSAEGPVLIAYNWLDAESAKSYHPVLKKTGYLPTMPFNKVLDIVLVMLNLKRSDLYVTQAFHLLPTQRSEPISVGNVDTSFDAVTKHELKGRRVVALGGAAASACKRHGINHTATCHPSSRGGSYEDMSRMIAGAIAEAMA